MDPRYAFFIWASFGVTFAVVVWNALSPRLTRNQLKARLSDALNDAPEDSGA